MRLLKKVTKSLIGSVILLASSLLMSAPEILLQSDHSWDGGSFSYLQGKPKITSVKLNLKEGVKARFHCHPVPTMGFVSKGLVELENKAGKTKRFKAGDSVIEVMKGLHRGFSINGDAEIIVFYAGVKNIPNTVFPENKEKFKKHCQ